MRTMAKVRDFFGRGTNVRGDGMFETYYGNLLVKGQEGGPNAQEARRDFASIRKSVGGIYVY